MLFRKITVYFESNMKPVNTLCGENSSWLNKLAHQITIVLKGVNWHVKIFCLLTQKYDVFSTEMREGL
jgi:hypothetical protein